MAPFGAFGARHDDAVHKVACGLQFPTTSTNEGDGTWATRNASIPVSTANEHDCNGIFPCPGIDYGNQQGDYEGLASFGGLSHPIWTDSRDQLLPSQGCRTDLTMEKVFSATVNQREEC